MANIGGSQTDAFGAGINHLTNTGRSNESSITLGDAGLGQTSARWDGMTPHSVLASTAGGQDDSPFERVQRESGGYQPGQIENFQDQISNGDDDNTP